MASKNMRSEGYIQFPVVLSAPVSPSLFAGLGLPWVPPPLLEPGVDIARGIVDTSRVVPSPMEDRMPRFEARFLGDCSVCEGSRPVAWRGDAAGVGAGGCGDAPFCSFACLSHASRVLWSTGQADGCSVSEVIVKDQTVGGGGGERSCGAFGDDGLGWKM